MDDLKSSLDNIQLHLEKRVEKVEHKQDTLQREQRSTRVKVDQLATKQDDLQQQQGSTTAKLEQLAINQEVLHQEVASTGVKVDHVEQRVTELESQEKCSAPETISFGEFLILIFYL
jgi:chromosome segregation ATPase